MKKLRIVNNRMTTLVFAEMIGVDHSDILKKSRNLLDELGAGSGEFYITHLHVQKKERPTLSLDRDLSVMLAAQYSIKIAYHVGKEFNNNIKIDKNQDHKQIDGATENVEYCLRDAIKDYFDFSSDTRSFVTTLKVVDHLVINSGLPPASLNNYKILADVMENLGIKKTRMFGKGRGYQLPPMKFNTY